MNLHLRTLRMMLLLGGLTTGIGQVVSITTRQPPRSTQKAPIRSPKKGQKGMGQSQPKLSVEKKKPKNTSQLTASPQKKKKAVVKKVVKKVPSSKAASHPQSKQNASSQKKKPANRAQPSKSDASKPNGK